MPDNSVQHICCKHEYLVGIDLGTSSIKGVLISSEGVIVSKQKAETQYHSSKDGFIEFDAEKFYILIVDIIHKLVLTLPKGASIVGISMASASGNTLLVDDSNKIMTAVISWMDTRVTDEIETVFGQLNDREVHELIGWPLSKIFPLAHLCWLKCHKPKLLEKATKICMSTEYVNFRLTGEWGIDNSTATTFYLQDQKVADWHLPYLQKLGIPTCKLPPIHIPGTILGRIMPNVAEVTGLSVGTPVVLGSFDHPCAARGSGVLEEGQLLISCGTSWVGFYPLKDRHLAVNQKLLIDPFLQKEGLWGVMFSLTAISDVVDK